MATEEASVPNLNSVPCYDWIRFKSVLMELRKTDDLIDKRLNDLSRGRTQPEKEVCADLWGTLEGMYAHRNAALKRCIQATEEDIERLKQLAESDPDSTEIDNDLFEAKSRKQMMGLELDVERIVENRSRAAFKVKCSSFPLPRRGETDMVDKLSPMLFKPGTRDSA